jgi:ABC-type amino acid transport substrate-binding protein
MRACVAKLAGVAAVLLATAAAQAAVAPLRLCADPSNMPFSSSAPEDVGKGAPGLYVEIGAAIAEALGRPMETVWSLSYFGKRNLRTTLLAGRCDFAVGLPAVPDFMGPRVIFSRPILRLGYALVLPKGDAVAGLDGLRGKRVAVQFASPPQSLLATRDDITAVTTLDPEDAMRRLAAGEVDAAFVWGPSAGYINHRVLHDAYRVIPVDAPQMQWSAAIGFSSKQAALRDEVDAVLGGLAARIQDLAAKYAVAQGPPLKLSDPGETAVPAGDPAAGKVTFNGTCAHCHGPDAVASERRIDLRRLKHKYGDQMPDVFFTTVTNGRPAKGMPSWKNVFSREDFVNILAYLKTIQQ